MRNLILTSIAILALAGGAVAQTTATTSTKPATMTKKEKKAAAKATAPAPAMAAKPAMATKPAMIAPAKPMTAAPAKPAMAAPAKPAMATTPMTTASAGGRKPMTPESKACSAQADAKGLHGKDREKFRRGCLKG